LQNDREVSDAAVDDLGVFEFRDLRPGVHSLVAVGAEGFAAFSVHILPPTERTAILDRSPLRLAAINRAERPLELDISMVGPQDFAALRQIADLELPADGPPAVVPAAGAADDQPPPPQPITSQGRGGTGGTSSGSQFGLTPLGAILGGAGVGFALAADSDSQPRTVSPFGVGPILAMEEQPQPPGSEPPPADPPQPQPEPPPPELESR
jgi:hypothetical protein